MKEFTQMHIGQFKEFPLQSENKSKGKSIQMLYELASFFLEKQKLQCCVYYEI